MKSDLCECDCKCGQPKQASGSPESDGRLCAGCNGASCELPPGPTWDEALAVIRRHSPEAAERLMQRRYALRHRALHEDTIYVFPLCHHRALVRLESEVLDLYEQLREKEVADAE